MNTLRRCVLMVLVAAMVFVSSGHGEPTQANLSYTLAVAWSHSGNQLAVVGVRPTAADASGLISILDTNTQQLIYSLDTSINAALGGFTSASWSPNDRFLAVSSYDGTIWIIDIEAKLRIAQLLGHQSTVSEVDWSSDGKTLVSVGNWDKLVILWDASSFQILRRIENAGFVRRVSFSPDGSRIAVAQESVLSVFPSTLPVGISQTK